MHNKIPRIFTFIDSFDEKKIFKLNSNVGIIYRNYNKNLDINIILKIKKVCKLNNNKFYLANNIKLAVQNNLDGAYIPSFNKKLNVQKFKVKRNFIIMGSAHNIQEIKIKEKQGVEIIFLSPIFQTKNYKNHLGIIKFNFLLQLTKKKVVALGGINKKNLNRLKISNAYGFSAIKYFSQT